MSNDAQYRLMLAEIEKLRKQRDELLQALKSVEPYCWAQIKDTVKRIEADK